MRFDVVTADLLIFGLMAVSSFKGTFNGCLVRLPAQLIASRNQNHVIAVP